MQDKRAQNRRQLQSLLRELFQFDYADLDFGIYRIMREKHDDVERFIEHDLLDAVEEGLAHFQAAEREELEAQLAQKRQLLGAAALDETGAAREEFQGLPVAQDYTRVRKQLQQLDVAEETEAQIFNDLWRFFSRYYDDGDFLTQRRYSSRESRFCVPYDGEEVLLHWANRDQYYVKTGERFTDYRFDAGDYGVWFRLQQAEVPQDNVKAGDTRYFVLRTEDPLAYDAESRVLTISFEYRPLTDEEEAHYLGVYNAQQTRSRRRKTLDRSALCVALEEDILSGLDHADLKAHLAAVPQGQASSTLGRHLNHYTARNTMDYFVHKDLGGFLGRELDFFLKNEVLRVDDVVRDESGEVMAHVLTRMRVVRRIARRIIAFLAQIEDFQRRLFEKKKFVVQTDYCVTLDRVPEMLYPEILANEAQLEEWRRLYNVDAWEENLFWQGEFDEAFLRNHPYVMVDTAFFDAGFKARLLASFEDLDGATDGVLIHGENFQALNLMMAKHGGQVQCIYIDPPYNTGNDEFIYKDNYQHSSWLTMMRDRVHPARGFLGNDGLLFSSIDENEVDNLIHLLTRVLGERVGIIVVKNNPKGRSLDRYLSTSHEYVLAFAKQQTELAGIPKSEEQLAEYGHEDEGGRYRLLELRNTHRQFNRGTRPNLWFPLYVDPGTNEVSLEASAGHIEIYPLWEDGMEGCWTWGQDRVEQKTHLLVGRKVNGRWKIYRKDYARGATYTPKTIWADGTLRTDYAQSILDDVMGERAFQSPKPPALIQRACRLSSDNAEFVLDFFAGSGTTAHAVIDLNREDGGERKYILVEVGDHFDTVLKPRIQKVAFSANWKDGVPQDRDGVSHVFKYQRIESYEDALNNIRVRQPQGAQRRLLYEEFDDYQLHYMLDFETRDSPTLLAQEAFERPFDYTLKIQRGHESPQPETVDLVETFHYLIGMHVRRLERHTHQGRPYVVSRGEMRTERGVERTVVIWRDTPDLDLHQEADWANEALLAEPVGRVYVNGPSHIKGAQPLEIAFRNGMEGVHH
jgi:adenine-specific DNA-methyltransferase